MSLENMLSIRPGEQRVCKPARPEGLPSDELLQREVTNPSPHRGQVIRLDNGITVVLNSWQMTYEDCTASFSLPCDAGIWKSIIVASENVDHRVGENIIIRFAEARRAVLIDPGCVCSEVTPKGPSS